MKCIHCLSTKTVKNGYSDKRVQRFKCNGCGKRFCERGFFARFRHKQLDIINTVRLRMRRLSTRETADEVAQLIYLHISHVTVWNWCMKFIKLLVLWAKLFFSLQDSPVIHIDEKFIKVRKSKDSFAYLFIAKDEFNKIRAIYLANARTTESEKEFFRRLIATENKTEIAVTDACQIYVGSVKILGRKVRHVQAHFKPVGIVHKRKLMQISNNTIERLNSDIDLFLHVFRGLKSFETANIWLEVFVVYHNYLKPSAVKWWKIPKMITSRREITPQIIFWIYLSPFKLTESLSHFALSNFFNTTFNKTLKCNIAILFSKEDTLFVLSFSTKFAPISLTI